MDILPLDLVLILGSDYLSGSPKTLARLRLTNQKFKALVDYIHPIFYAVGEMWKGLMKQAKKYGESWTTAIIQYDDYTSIDTKLEWDIKNLDCPFKRDYNRWRLRVSGNQVWYYFTMRNANKRKRIKNGWIPQRVWLAEQHRKRRRISESLWR